MRAAQGKRESVSWGRAHAEGSEDALQAHRPRHRPGRLDFV